MPWRSRLPARPTPPFARKAATPRRLRSRTEANVHEGKGHQASGGLEPGEGRCHGGALGAEGAIARVSIDSRIPPLHARKPEDDGWEQIHRGVKRAQVHENDRGVVDVVIPYAPASRGSPGS
jgi:hypothetical protein